MSKTTRMINKDNDPQEVLYFINVVCINYCEMFQYLTEEIKLDNSKLEEHTDSIKLLKAKLSEICVDLKNLATTQDAVNCLKELMTANPALLPVQKALIEIDASFNFVEEKVVDYNHLFLVENYPSILGIELSNINDD